MDSSRSYLIGLFFLIKANIFLSSTDNGNRFKTLISTHHPGEAQIKERKPINPLFTSTSFQKATYPYYLPCSLLRWRINTIAASIVHRLTSIGTSPNPLIFPTEQNWYVLDGLEKFRSILRETSNLISKSCYFRQNLGIPYAYQHVFYSFFQRVSRK